MTILDRMWEDDDLKPTTILLEGEQAKQLYDLLSSQYISYEFHPAVIELVRQLRQLLDE